MWGVLQCVFIIAGTHFLRWYMYIHMYTYMYMWYSYMYVLVLLKTATLGFFSLSASLLM